MKVVLLVLSLGFIIGCGDSNSESSSNGANKSHPERSTAAVKKNSLIRKHSLKLSIYETYMKNVNNNESYVLASQMNADFICNSVGFDYAEDYESQNIRNYFSSMNLQPYIVISLTPSGNYKMDVWGDGYTQNFMSIGSNEISSTDEFIKNVTCIKNIK